MISNRLIGRSISHTEISSANADFTEAVEKWRMRDLSHESIKYLFIDDVTFPMRIDGSIERVPLLVANRTVIEKVSRWIKDTYLNIKEALRGNR